MKDAHDTSPTSPTREIPKTMSQQFWKVISWTFAWEGQIRSRNLSSMYLPIPTHHHAVSDLKLRPEPEAEVLTSAGTVMEIGVGDRRVRFREEGDSSRQHLDTSSDRESMEEPRGKMPRRSETSESAVPSQSSQASSSERQQVSTAASDNPIGERLYMSMTEEGPLGDYRQGRWMPTKRKRAMNTQEAREARRSFYVGGKQGAQNLFDRVGRDEPTAWMIFISADGTPTRYLGTTFLPRTERNFHKQSTPSGKECSISRL